MKHDRITFPRWFNNGLVITLLAGMISGCSAGAVVTKSVSYAVSKYCEVPEAGRKAVRKAVRRAVSPNSITIDCVPNG
jgi:hypothetical protein